MACSWVSHQYFCHFWRSLPKLGGSSLQVLGRQKSTTACHLPLRVKGQYFSASVNLKEIFEQPNNQESLESCEPTSDGESTGGHLLVESNKTEDIPYTLDKNLNSSGLKLANGRLMLIDGTAAMYRAYYQLMASLHYGNLEHADGNGDWVLSIFKALSTMLDMLELCPSHIAVVFDHRGFEFGYNPPNLCQEFCGSTGPTFRHTLYPAYKSNRMPTPDTIVQALQYLKAALQAMSVKVPGVEADDVIGTLAVNGVAAGLKVRVVSPDKDFFQILCPSLRLLRISSRGSRIASFGVEQFAEKYGDLKPSQIVDVMALAGDNADFIPGVHGIGDMNALKLIIKFGSLENLLANLDRVPDGAIRKALLFDDGQALLSKELATLRCNLPYCMVPFHMSDLLFQKP
uniref:5'-3' exonuclease domain-containing protein n=1 Tax=Picea sitchensis TaxID=3332 RepID=B8LLQ0_PICSI|nr:unknown [Picea sitchensis]